MKLPQSLAELPSVNSKVSRIQYDQHPPTRDVTGTNFPNGAIHTRFEIAGTKRWIPSKSYIRMRCELNDNAGNQLELSDGVAPAMGLMSNLFQSGEFRIADKTVSRVSDYMAQVDALKTRTSKSRAWLESTGKATNFWQSTLDERKNAVSSDGKDYDAKFDVASRTDMGYSGANTVTIAADTGILTFAAGTLVNTDVNFVAGDEIEVDFAAGTLRLTVAEVPAGGNTLRISEAKTLAVGAEAVEFRRLRRVVSRKVRYFELIWQPPMSIFDCDKALPAGKYELVLNPQTSGSYKTRIAESLVAKTSGTDYDFAVVDMYLYTATLESERIDDLSYYIDLDEVRCQSDDASNATSLTQKNFDVSPSTYALTCAFQDAGVGSSTIYSSSKLKVRTDLELGLNRMFITYAGQSKPSPDADPSYATGTATDYTIQRYSDSLLQSGQFMQEGGSETIQEWQERGPYYHFQWNRDGADRSTRAQVNYSFATSLAGNGRVLIFDWHKALAHIMVKSGRVVDVSLIDA